MFISELPEELAQIYMFVLSYTVRTLHSMDSQDSQDNNEKVAGF